MWLLTGCKPSPINPDMTSSYGHPGWTDSSTPSHTGRVHQIDLSQLQSILGWLFPIYEKKCSRPPTSIPCWFPASLTNPLSQDQIVIKRWCKLQLPGWMLAFDLRSWPIMWIYPLVSIIFWGGSFYIFPPQSQVAVGQRIGVGAIILQLVRWEPQRNTRQQLLWQISANYDNA